MTNQSKRKHKLYSGKLWPHLSARLGKEGKALLAVSGGVDSVSMLHLVKPPDISERERIYVVYINHKTGEYADNAEKFVRKLSSELGFKFTSKKVNIAESDLENEGFESVARKARYKMFEQVAEKNICSLILTGHTLDDRAESALLFMFRGSGAGGISGARENRGKYWRPLLHYSHKELDEFLKADGLEIIEDPSNRDQRFARNRVRILLRPFIEENFGTGAWKNIARSAERLAMVESIVEKEAEKGFKKITLKRLPYWILLDTSALRLYLQELRTQILRLAWLHASGLEPGDENLPRNAVRKLLSLVNGKPGYNAELPSGVIAWRVKSGLILDGTALNDPIKWELPGEISLPDGTKLEATKCTPEEFGGISIQPGRVEHLDAGIVGNRLVIRPWREGDRFEPLGRPGNIVKVTRVLSGSYSKADGPLWVAESKNKIVYIPGHRISDSCRVQSGSKKLWRLTCIPPQ